ncbi:hypothetical protein SAMN05661010_02513 [Modicisalibacter muralis]|uniref:Uncharacterized protein n=1 Tax=Modicisalibacter muralis TaxID=119000 RepID=A0A1G9MTK2_9GAMM|nr:hypothetical protein [Halomonas muralis]SDL77549.1 hypothetical protein SAMN05661010_02513 [Halomonas muralis]
MPQAKTVTDALQEAMNLSEELERRRPSISPFDVRRLERMANPKGGNRLAFLVKEVLVGEITRDFNRAYDAVEHIVAEPTDPWVFPPIASLAMLCFNPTLSLTVVRKALPMHISNAVDLERLMQGAWFSGDLGLCHEIDQKLRAAKGEMAQDYRIEEMVGILDEAGVSMEEYRDYVAGFHLVLRKHYSGQAHNRISLGFDALRHEDGQRSIVFQVFSDLDDEALDRLDDDLMERQSDPSAVKDNLASVVSYLVRDMPRETPVQEGAG